MIRKFIYIWIAVFLLSSQLSPRGAYGLTVSEEEKLSRGILGHIYQQYELIEDPAIVDYVNKVGNRIGEVLEEPLFKYRFHVIKVDS